MLRLIRPMSLADACLVRMTELDDSSAVMTLDRDFLVYRRHGRQLIPVTMPPELSAASKGLVPSADDSADLGLA